MKWVLQNDWTNRPRSKPGPPSKRPPKAVLNNLYWMDGLDQSDIAGLYNVTQSTVGRWLVDACIPARKFGPKCRHDTCLGMPDMDKACHEPLAVIKRFDSRGRMRWATSSRCPKHFHLWRNYVSRQWYLRTQDRGCKKPGPRPKLPIGSLAIIKKDDQRTGR